MIELWLKYTDRDGEVRRANVDKDKFAIGRHSENDLAIADSRLSREHALVERFGDIFVVSDRGSSNGTELNGAAIDEPAALTDGDKLSLGGLEVELEFVSDEAGDTAPPPAEQQPATAAANQAAPQAATGSLPTAVFIVAPILAVLILTIVGLALYLAGGRSQVADNSDFIYSGDSVDTPRNRSKGDNSAGPPSGSNNIVSTVPTPASNSDLASPTPTGSQTDAGKAEQYAAAFLRRAAANDPKAFITGQQAQILTAKIKSISSSSALADNINSARRNSAQIRLLAQSKNLRPQLLAAAAITKLGGARGDVLQSAQSMADTLDKLGVQVGNELGDDCLLMMAAYDQGAAGDFLKLRNLLQDLATKMPQSSRAIRSIWFLKTNGKITDGQYDLALRFLAVGTIMENPRDFGVNAEALSL